MRVLLLFPMADGQTGPAIKHAFEQLGHEVRTVDAKLTPHDSYKIAYDFKPGLVFCSRTQALTWKVQEIKTQFKNVVICMWNVDTGTRIIKWKHLFPLIDLCDYHFVVNAYHVDGWNRRFKAKAVWLPQGLQDEVYDKPKEIMREDKERYSCDVSFAGGGRSLRPPFLNAVDRMGVNFKRWGCGGMPKVYNEEHNKMVSLSSINLGISRMYGNNVDKYVSVRDYKILGAGGFLLELYRKGIHEVFPKHVIKCYTSPEDLVEKIRYWLNPANEWERWRIADTAYRWVRENATYTHRIRDALEIMGL